MVASGRGVVNWEQKIWSASGIESGAFAARPRRDAVVVLCPTSGTEREKWGTRGSTEIIRWEPPASESAASE
jgi:hypothetical protein